MLENFGIQVYYKYEIKKKKKSKILLKVEWNSSKNFERFSWKLCKILLEIE